MMDDFEKRVLRKRKPTFAESVTMDENFLNIIRRANLITDDHVQAVKAEKNVEHRTSHLIDHVMAARVSSGFDVFTNVLMTDYAWLAKELQADLKAERGSLEIDEVVMNEAGMLVHRKFGTSKRIAEMDKKEIAELIATKIQISKEEFKEEIGVLQQEIHRLEGLIDEYEKKARDTDGFLQKFIHDNESKLMSLAHGNKSTSDVLRTSDNDTDALAILRTRVKTLVARTKVVMEERDLLFDDREKTMSFLQASSNREDDSAKITMIHELLRERAKGKPDEATRLREELTEKDRVIQRLRKLVSESEEERPNAELQGLKEELDAKVQENHALKATTKQLEIELAELKSATKAAAAPSVGNSKSKARRGSKP